MTTRSVPDRFKLIVLMSGMCIAHQLGTLVEMPETAASVFNRIGGKACR
jgi:hypothetical protein